MTLAAVAGAALFTRNIQTIPLTDFKAELIDFSDQFLIISEHMQFLFPFLLFLTKRQRFIIHKVREYNSVICYCDKSKLEKKLRRNQARLR